MIDIHAHLHDSAFDADRDLVVARASAAGVTKIITIGTDIEESGRAVACAERYEGVYASVGIHPHFFDEEYRIWNREYRKGQQIQNGPRSSEGIDIQYSTFNILSEKKERIQDFIINLKKIAESSSKVIAIGECGLDYFVHREYGRIETADAPAKGGQAAMLGGTTVISERQKKIQKEGFLAQIELAKELNLPLIIHCRPSVGTVDAYEDLYQILTDYKRLTTNDVKTQEKHMAQSSVVSRELSIVLHCYMGDTKVTQKFLELPNTYFSFTGNITYATKKVLIGTKDDLMETVKMIPIERMLAETDCPYLAPVPYRGKRNEPAYTALVVEKIAEIKVVSQEEVKQVVTASVERIFGV